VTWFRGGSATFPTEQSRSSAPGEATAEHLRTFSRVAPVVILVGAILVWTGWAANIQWLIHPQAVWPSVAPWTTIWLALLAVATLLQSVEAPTQSMVWLSRAMTAVVATLSFFVLFEYRGSTSTAFDVFWFHHSVTASTSTWPGRPSVQMALAGIALSLVIALLRVDAKLLRLPQIAFVIVATVPALVAVGGYLFNVPALFTSSGAWGLSLITAIGVLVLSAAAIAARPDRPRIAKLIARADWVSIRRLAFVLTGFPLVVEILRLIFESLGAPIQSAWALAVSLGTFAAGIGIYQVTADQNHAMMDKLALATELASSQEHYRLLAENSTDVVLLIEGGVITWISPSVQDVLGGDVDYWVGREAVSAVHPDDLTAYLAVRGTLEMNRTSVFRVRVMTGDGRYHWVELHAKRYTDPNGGTDSTIASMSVVDDAVAAEARLDQLARTDALTGLANRGQAMSFLHDHVDRPRRPGTDLGVLFCDVDRFKTINDQHGHAAGDIVLTTLSNRIASRVRQGDLVARLGGDEFIVFLVGTHGLTEAAAIAEEIRAIATAPIELDSGMVTTSLSIGVTVAAPGETPDALVARADDAMYRAKGDGRNRVVFIAHA